MEKSEPSQMQLYSQIIAAYDNAGLWPLFKYVYTESGDKMPAKGWFLILVLLGLIILSFGISGIIICYLNIIKEKWFFILFWTLCIVTVTPVLAYVYYFEKKLKTVFSEDINNYGGLEKSFFNHRDFYRYILFRNELNKSKINPEYITI